MNTIFIKIHMTELVKLLTKINYSNNWQNAKKKKNENPAKSDVEKKKEKKLIAIAKLFLLRANKQTKEKQK